MYIRTCKQILQSDNLLSQLNFISYHFQPILHVIESLQSNSNTIEYSLSKIRCILNNLDSIQGEIGIDMQGKMKAILKRNPDFETVIKYLEDKIDSENHWHNGIPIKLLKFAPLTSVDCERSFSAHKYILDVKRNKLSPENLEKNIFYLL